MSDRHRAWEGLAPIVDICVLALVLRHTEMRPAPGSVCDKTHDAVLRKVNMPSSTNGRALPGLSDRSGNVSSTGTLPRQPLGSPGGPRRREARAAKMQVRADRG